ncbi:uncharacterized protein igsf9b [Etheostoma cragini]|uniref:uncharacterized protein igsf9b n=1 Tax=Etheostoma cragini TaxID=417921 RepID=UPI00155E299A|nr:uncharacterized protein igsf9b [Etheostoma cragini]
MEVYPVRPRYLELIPEPLLAGVLGGVCFLFVAIILSLVTACYMSQRRERRRKNRRKDLPSALQKSSSSPQARSPPRSPDSVLKLKLCSPLPFFSTSSSSQSDRSSFDKGSRGEYHNQRKQLLSNSSPPPHYTLFESHLGSQDPSPTALESISRGPDGRFIVQPLLKGSSPSNHINLRKEVVQSNGGASGSGSNRTSLRDSPKSSVLSSEKEERRNSPLTVDVPELSRPPSSPGRVRAMARNFSRHGCFYSDDEQCSEALLERASFYSDNSEKKPSDSLRRYRLPGHTEDLFSSLGRKTKLLDRDRDRPGYQPMESQLTNNSTVVSQLDSELERESFNKCVQLQKEREEMERELESYTTEQRGQGRGSHEQPFEKAKSPQRESPESEEEPVWKPQVVTIRQKHRHPGQTNRVSDYRRACYFGNTSSPMDRLATSRVHWDISPVTSLTSLIPAQETTSPRDTRRDTTDISFAVDSSRSPVTQNTSLPMLSPDVSSQSLKPPDRARSLSPPREPERSRKSVTEQGLGVKAQDKGAASRSRHSYAYAGTQPWSSAARGPESSASAACNQPAKYYTATRDPSPSIYSTLPYEHDEVRAKAKDKDTQARDERRSSGFYSEFEREGVRARSRRSDKCLFSDSPSPISTLTLVEEVKSDQSQCSVPAISGSFKAKPAAPSPQMSPLQTSAILEYLSLPGFIEMSVDEPLEDATVTDNAGQSPALKPVKSTDVEPDVVPRNWEVHVQEKRETHPNGQPAGAAEAGSRAGKTHPEARDSSHRVRFPDDTRPSLPGPEKTCKQLYNEKTQIRVGNKSADRPESRLGSRSAHTLLSAARGMADIVSKHSHSFVDSSESLPEQSKRQRTNNIASRICQAPVPFLKKSVSVGPCRTLSGMGQPRPFLKKSISLGSQRWEHFESPRTYISEKCYWDEFPNPDVRLKSYSLGRSPPSLPRPGPSWREYVPFRRPPSMWSLERPHHTHRYLASPPYLTQSMYPPRQTSMSPMLEPADPRRQAAVFPESSRWSPNYHEAVRSAQHKYVPIKYQQWPGSRGEGVRPVDPGRGPPRSYLPRGISWPSPCYAPFPPRRGGEAEPREGGRASYASQSSGRGSAGLFRQSLSITPTLLSSPETTEDSERHRAETEPPERRQKRRNTSVDESYEWDSADACLDSEVLEATRFDPSGFRRGGADPRHDQAAGLQDRRQKGELSFPLSPSLCGVLMF